MQSTIITHVGHGMISANTGGFAQPDVAAPPTIGDTLNDTINSLCHAMSLAEQISDRARGSMPRAVVEPTQLGVQNVPYTPNLRALAIEAQDRAARLCAELSAIQATL